MNDDVGCLNFNRIVFHLRRAYYSDIFFTSFSLVSHFQFVRSYELEHTSTKKFAESLKYDTDFGVEFFDFDFLRASCINE